MPPLNDEADKKDFVPKQSLKQVSGQKSMFEQKPKQQTQQEFESKVHNSQDRQSGYKKKASDLFIRFNKAMADKTLAENKTIFSNEAEGELLKEMMVLSEEINNDINEKEGTGSLTWIALLFKTCISQRNRLNKQEYDLQQLNRRTDPAALTELINKQISAALALDKTTKNG